MSAEFTNDVNQIVATVSAKPSFGLLRWKGGRGSILSTPAAVRDFYTESALYTETLGSKQTKRLASDWFVFQESIVSFRYMGDALGVDVVGTEYRGQFAVIFPIREPGTIVGEFPVARFHHRELIEAAAERRRVWRDDTVEGSLRAIATHDAFLEALLSGGGGAIGEMLADNFVLMAPDPSSDGVRFLRAEGCDDAARCYEAAFATSNLQVEMVARIATDWYVFAEYEWRTKDEDGDRVRRTASIYSLNEKHQITAEIGCGPGDERAVQ